jgi:hypothetical protein
MAKYFGILRRAKMLSRKWKAKLVLARDWHGKMLKRRVF